MSRRIISCRDSGESGEWRRCDDDAAETQTRRVEEGVEGVEDVCRRKREIQVDGGWRIGNRPGRSQTQGRG
jgi:hypothetical protein